MESRTITDVRGVGLMIGVEVRTPELAELVQRRAFERGLLVLECGERSIRVSPPLVINREQAATAVKILGEVFGESDLRIRQLSGACPDGEGLATRPR